MKFCFCHVSTLKDIHSTCAAFHLAVEVFVTLTNKSFTPNPQVKLSVLNQQCECPYQWVFALELPSLGTESTIVCCSHTESKHTDTPRLPAPTSLLFLILRRSKGFSVKGACHTIQSSWISQKKVSYLQVMIRMWHVLLSSCSEGLHFHFPLPVWINKYYWCWWYYSLINSGSHFPSCCSLS